MSDSPQSRFRLPHWGWFLLAPVLLIIGFLGLSVWWQWHREQQLVLMIESWGGYVETETGGPDWLQQLVGKGRIKKLRVFDRITRVDLVGEANTDAEVAQLGGLTNLKVLLLDSSAVTDAGIAHLSGLKNLEYVSLDGTTVTDAGLAHLSKCTAIEVVHLSGTPVTDAGLAHLKRLPYLRGLMISKTAVTNAGLIILSGCTYLRSLDISGTAVTGNGIDNFKRTLPGCQIIH